MKVRERHIRTVVKKDWNARMRLAYLSRRTVPSLISVQTMKMTVSGER
jgi:hypothetical protein